MTDQQPQPVILDRAYIFDGEDGPPRLERISKASTQMDSGDPYQSREGAENGLEQPLYDMDQLAGLLGAPGSPGNSLHYRCVQQKASDTLGRGVVLRAANEDEPGAEGESDTWGEFLEAVEDDGDGSFKERLTWAHEDYESIGWGVLEVSRNAQGVIDGLWHVPAHTVRAHRDGVRYAQRRQDKLVWFKRFGAEGDVDRKRGGWTKSRLTQKVRGNEVIVLKNYTPMSSYYGLPDHIPALGALAGWTAQQEFNIRFFGNQAVPAYAVVVEGAELTPELEALILEHFKRIKGDPGRTIVIPVPAALGMGADFQPKVRFERLSVEVKEASFRMYRQDSALEICIAHGVPPYRVGWPIVGSLGGSTAEEMTNIYNDGIIQTRQETWEHRLNRTLLGRKGLDLKTWLLKVNELDVRNEMRDIDKAKGLYELGATTPADSAKYFGYERDDPAAHDYIAQPLSPQGGTMPVMDEGVAKAWNREVQALAELRQTVEKAVEKPHLVAVGGGQE